MDPRPLDNDLTGSVFVEWHAPEHEHFEKTADWYWWSGLLALILLGIAIWQSSFLFAVLVVIGWIALAVNAAHIPRDIRLAVAERGLVIDNKLYFWKDLDSFWVFYEPPLRKEIIVQSKKAIMPRIRIQIGDSNPTLVREQMVRFLREREQDDSLMEMLARLARF